MEKRFTAKTTTSWGVSKNKIHELRLAWSTCHNYNLFLFVKIKLDSKIIAWLKQLI